MIDRRSGREAGVASARRGTVDVVIAQDSGALNRGNIPARCAM
jgi:hypothetical protein